jgi:hypothetical protein
MMLFTSSILTYYLINTPTPSSKEHRMLALQAWVVRWLSIFLRRSGKLIAAFNAVCIVATGLLQFGGFYGRCYCDSSVIGLGKHAYNVMSLVPDDVGGMRTAWIGGFALAAGAAMIFAGFVTVFIDPQ